MLNYGFGINLEYRLELYLCWQYRFSCISA